MVECRMANNELTHTSFFAIGNSTFCIPARSISLGFEVLALPALGKEQYNR